MAKIKKLIVEGFYQLADEPLLVSISGLGSGNQMYDRYGLEHLIIKSHPNKEELTIILSELKNLDFRFAGELAKSCGRRLRS